MFRFYHNQLTNASRTVAGFLVTIALVLIGMGVLILALPAIFVAIAAGIFFLAGLSCAIWALKIFMALWQTGKTPPSSRESYRKNVRIHYETFDED